MLKNKSLSKNDKRTFNELGNQCKYQIQKSKIFYNSTYISNKFKGNSFDALEQNVVDESIDKIQNESGVLSVSIQNVEKTITELKNGGDLSHVKIKDVLALPIDGHESKNKVNVYLISLFIDMENVKDLLRFVIMKMYNDLTEYNDNLDYNIDLDIGDDVFKRIDKGKFDKEMAKFSTDIYVIYETIGRKYKIVDLSTGKIQKRKFKYFELKPVASNAVESKSRN